MSELSSNTLNELLGSPELVEAILESCACGSPRTLSLGLNNVVCTDTSCVFKIATRIYTIIEKYKLVNHITLSEVENLCQDRYYRSWIDFFTDEWEETEYADLHTRLVQAIKSDLDVPTIVMFTGFDCLSNDQVYNLCGDFQTVSDLASVLESDGVIFIAERLGLNASHLVPVAIHIYNNLTMKLSEMLEAEDLFY